MKKIIKCEDIEFQIYIEDTDFQGVVYHSNYLKAAELGNQIVVQSKVEKKSDARMIFYQKVVDKISGEELVNGEIEVCFINLSSKKPKKFPDDLLLIFD